MKTTKRLKAEFMQNLQKGKNITEPIEAKPLTDFSKLQNKSYLETRYYKTNSLNKTHVFYALFTKRCVAKIRWGSLPLAKGETEGFETHEIQSVSSPLKAFAKTDFFNSSRSSSFF